MREMTTGFQTQIEAAQLSPCLLVKADLDSGVLALWSGIGTVSYGGQSYTGAGKLLGVSEIKETQNLEAVGISVTLSGIPSDLISIALTEPYQGRSLTVYFAVLDTTGAIISAVVLFSGELDIMEIRNDGQSGTITVKCESDLILLREAVNRFYTPEDQKARYSNDKGLDYIPTLQDKEITWGQGVQ